MGEAFLWCGHGLDLIVVVVVSTLWTGVVVLRGVKDVGGKWAGYLQPRPFLWPMLGDMVGVKDDW